MLALAQIDSSLKPKRPQLFIAKPNRQILGKLNNKISGLEYIPKLGRLGELSFEVSYELTHNLENKLIKNPIIDIIRDRYVIKAKIGNKEEWFIINEITDSMDASSKVSKSVHAYSLGYELNDKNLRNYKVISKNLPTVASDALNKTNWKVGDVDATFVVKYRSFDVSEQSILDFMYEISETYGALLEFDTVNRLIHFRDPETIGADKGLTVSYGKYLKSLGKTSDPDEMVTRLHVYGKDNLSINRVNPTGTSFIEDFTYFMFPFERDEDGNVIQSSDYMSDELCHAILDYGELVKSKDGQFDTLLAQQEDLQVELLAEQSELFDLQTELTIILDQLDIAKATEKDTAQLEEDRIAKEAELNVKKAEVDDLRTQIENVIENIKELESELAVENNFSEELLAERNQYIIERTWTDSNYIDDKELYRDAVKVFAEVKQPKTSFDFDIISFIDVLEEQHNWDKLVLGDTITIKYEKIGVYIKAKITEITFNYDQPSIKLSIANVKDLHGDATKLLKMLKESHSSSLSFNMHKDTYDETVDKNNEISQIINDTWDAAKRRIVAGVNETVDISGRGIVIRNPDFPNEVLIATAGVLALSKDGGNTWRTAITPSHIVAETIMGKLIMGENMVIGDGDGTFEMKGNLLTLKDRQNVIRLLLGEYESNKFGLKLMDKTGKDVVLDENGMLQSWQEGRTDNVDTANGLTLYVYLPPTTLSVRQAILNFKLLPFRSYSRSTASGGATTQTSSSGGGTTATSSSGGGTSTSTSSGGGGTRTSSGGGGTTASSSFRADYQYVTGVDRPGEDGYSHYHNLYLPGHSHSVTIGNHSHTVSIPDHAHSFTVPNHTHSVTVPNHQHTVTIPAHTHDIQHGIYTSTTATGIGVVINGVNRTTALGGKFNTDKNNLNITPYLTIGQWNEIRLTSDRLGRIDGNVFVQAFMQI